MVGKTDPKTILLRLVALAGLFMLNMELYMIMLALVQIGQAWQISASSLQWLLSMYYLFFAAFTVVAGSLVDRFSSVRVMLYGLIIYFFLSLLAALALDFSMLLVVRCFQGIIAALLFNACISTLLTSFGKENRITAMSMSVAVVAIASAVGPFISASILGFFTWRILFVANMAVISIALILFFLAKPNIPSPKTHSPIKYIESLYFTIAAFLIIFGVNQLAPFEPLWKGLLPLITGLIVLLFFIRRELKSEDPLLDMKLLRYRPCLIANIIRFFIQGLAFFYFFALSLILQINFNLSHYSTAAIFVALALSQLTASLVIKKLTRKFSYKALIMLCLGSIFTACAVLSFPMTAEHLLILVAANIVIAVCIGMMLALLTAYVVMHVEPDRIGRANGLIYTFAFSGASILLALLNVIMAFYADRFLKHIMPMLKHFDLTSSQYQSLLHLSIGGSLKEAHLSSFFSAEQVISLLAISHKAFFAAYNGAMFWLSVASIVLFALSFLIKTERTKKIT